MSTEIVKLEINTTETGVEVWNNVASKMQKLANQTKKTTNATKDLDNSMSKSVMSGNLMAGAISRVGRALFRFATTEVSAAISEVATMDTKLRSISTLYPDLSAGTARYSGFLAETNQKLRDMSGGLGTAQELATGFYEIVSAGIDKSKAFDVLEVAANTAAAGLSNLKDTTSLLVGVMNSYGMSADEAQGVSDILFQTVVKGTATIGQMAKTVGRVTPIAAQMGISFEEVAASIATMTKGGLQASIATTGMRGAMLAMLKSVDKFKAEGVDIMDVLGKRGWSGAMEELVRLTDMGAIATRHFIPDARAFTAVMSLGREELAAYNDALVFIQDKDGAGAKALAKQAGGIEWLGREWAALGAKVREAAGNIMMDAILPLAQTAMPMVEDFIASIVRLREDGFGAELGASVANGADMLGTYWAQLANVVQMTNNLHKPLDDVKEKFTRLDDITLMTTKDLALMALAQLEMAVTGETLRSGLGKTIDWLYKKKQGVNELALEEKNLAKIEAARLADGGKALTFTQGLIMAEAKRAEAKKQSSAQQAEFDKQYDKQQEEWSKAQEERNQKEYAKAEETKALFDKQLETLVKKQEKTRDIAGVEEMLQKIVDGTLDSYHLQVKDMDFMIDKAAAIELLQEKTKKETEDTQKAADKWFDSIEKLSKGGKKLHADFVGIKDMFNIAETEAKDLVQGHIEGWVATVEAAGAEEAARKQINEELKKHGIHSSGALMNYKAGTEQARLHEIYSRANEKVLGAAANAAGKLAGAAGEYNTALINTVEGVRRWNAELDAAQVKHKDLLALQWQMKLDMGPVSNNKSNASSESLDNMADDMGHGFASKGITAQMAREAANHVRSGDQGWLESQRDVAQANYNAYGTHPNPTGGENIQGFVLQYYTNLVNSMEKLGNEQSKATAAADRTARATENKGSSASQAASVSRADSRKNTTGRGVSW